MELVKAVSKGQKIASLDKFHETDAGIFYEAEIRDIQFVNLIKTENDKQELIFIVCEDMVKEAIDTST